VGYFGGGEDVADDDEAVALKGVEVRCGHLGWMFGCEVEGLNLENWCFFLWTAGLAVPGVDATQSLTTF
jgi:hypothetical protein